MANPPYSGSVIVLRENADGIHAEVFHWDEIPAGEPTPPYPNGFRNQVFSGKAPTYHNELMAANRSALSTKFTQYVNAKFPDTPAS